MLGTLAVAIWLGITSERARRQRAVSAALREVNATLMYDFQFDGRNVRLDQRGNAVGLSTLPGYAGLRSWLGNDYFVNIVEVRLDGMMHAGISSWKTPDADRIDAKLLGRLGDLPKLRRLSLASVNVTTEGWDQIGRLSGLQSLNLDGVSINKESWAHLARLSKLEWLHLGAIESGVRFPAELGRLPYLKKIHLGRVPVTDDDLRRIAGLPRLEELWLVGMNLQRVSLANLAGAPKLEKLHLALVALGADSLAGMRKAHPKLKALRIVGGPLGDAELAGIGMISSLNSLA